MEQHGRQSHLVLSEAMEALQGEDRDGAFLARLIRGTTEYRLQLDYILDRFASIRTKKMKPQSRTILRMTVYQICHMDAVPDRAAVSEALLLAEEKGFGSLKRFVNGVLRAVVREKENIHWPDVAQDPAYALSIRYSVGQDLVEHWMDRYGLAETEAICRSFLEERPLWVHAFGGDPSCYALDPGTDPTALEAFREGRIYVQDRSSQKALEEVDIKPGDAVLDLCAAPGGKTLFAAERCAVPAEKTEQGTLPQRKTTGGGSGRVLARDISMEKVEKIRENLVRCHIDNVDLAVGDATVFDPALEASFDVVIADLPCSGYGVAGKKPEIKYKPYEETVRPLAELQRTILAHAVRYVRPGGKLLYSTCTIAEEENEQNCDWLCATYGQDGLIPVGEHVQMLPSQGPWDGFFYAVFRKAEG